MTEFVVTGTERPDKSIVYTVKDNIRSITTEYELKDSIGRLDSFFFSSAFINSLGFVPRKEFSLLSVQEIKRWLLMKRYDVTYIKDPVHIIDDKYNSKYPNLYNSRYPGMYNKLQKVIHTCVPYCVSFTKSLMQVDFAPRACKLYALPTMYTNLLPMCRSVSFTAHSAVFRVCEALPIDVFMYDLHKLVSSNDFVHIEYNEEDRIYEVTISYKRDDGGDAD
jgi:hypothetical protein